jgi:signal transduction histidine kinase
MAALKERAATPGTVAITAERQRIARDLHDGLCNSLTGLHMRLAVLGARHSDPAIAEELSVLGTEIESLLHDLRTVVWGMRSGDPSWQQLVAHLRGRLAEIVGGPVTIELEGAAEGERVPRALALALVKRVGSGCREAMRAGDMASAIVALEVGSEGVRLAISQREGSPTWAAELRHPMARPPSPRHA